MLKSSIKNVVKIAWEDWTKAVIFKSGNLPAVIVLKDVCLLKSRVIGCTDMKKSFVRRACLILAGLMLSSFGYGKSIVKSDVDNPLNQDGIGETEILVVSFGTSYNDSRIATIGEVEKSIQNAFPKYSVRRAFTSQIIIKHVLKRDGEKIDNVTEALDRAVNNGVKKLIVQPTHLMHGAEYDELIAALDAYKDKFALVEVAEPLLGEVGGSDEITNSDKKQVSEAVVADMAKVAGFKNRLAAEKAGTAFVLMGHGTSHDAKISYTQMAAQMKDLGYSNVFIGTVEGEPEETAVENIIEEVHKSGFKKVIIRPLMLVAGDHATNDMAGDEDDSWKSLFNASGYFDGVDCQILGLGQIPAIQKIYVAHTNQALKNSKKKLK